MGNTNYAQANEHYNRAMKGVLAGTVSQDDLVGQAKAVLKACDEYAPERKMDPQYEQQIQLL